MLQEKQWTQAQAAHMSGFDMVEAHVLAKASIQWATILQLISWQPLDAVHRQHWGMRYGACETAAHMQTHAATGSGPLLGAIPQCNMVAAAAAWEHRSRVCREHLRRWPGSTHR